MREAGGRDEAGRPGSGTATGDEMLGAMDRCERCGSALPPEARFCPSCGHPVRVLGTEPAPAASPPVPEALAAKMRGSTSSGQRKPVTALFADVVGSTAILEVVDPEDWSAIINRAFDIMSQAVFRYEGTIAHLMGDGLLAFFGAPVSHENDPERAVRAGLQLLRELDGLAEDVRREHGVDFRIRIGINTGPVVVGEVGSDLRYEYTALGDAINVTARIQSAARPGSLLVTAVTRRLAGAGFAYGPAVPLDVKGKSDPVVAFEVVGERPAAGSQRGLPGLSSPMVGRDSDLRELNGVVATVAAGRGSVGFVVGEPGIGKTRLVTELRRSKPGRTVAWIEARGVSYGRGLAYDVVRELVRSCLDAGGETAASLSDESRASLDHLLGGSARQAAFSPEAGSDPQAVRAKYVAAISDLLVAAGERAPVMALFEDLHWVDAASVEVLERVMSVAAEAPVGFLFTTREDRDTPGWRLVEETAAGGGGATVVRLAPLGAPAVRLMVGALLEIESLPGAVRDAILARASGNPFFVEEIIRMMIERGAIARRDDRWVATSAVSDLEIPETIHGLLLSRIDMLPDDIRRYARIAAVVGRAFDPDVVDEVARSADAATPVDWTGPMMAAGLAVGADGGRLAFRHVLIQEAAYDSLLKQDRRVLHGVVAEILEQRLYEAGPAIAGLVALHYERAGRGDRAIPHLRTAANYALERFANREAYDYFTRLESHLPGGDDEATLRLRIEAGIGRATAGDTFIPADQFVEMLEELLPSAEALGDPALVGEVVYWLVRARHDRGEVAAFSPRLQSLIERALDIADSLGDPKLRARPLALLGESKAVACDFEGAADIFEQAIPILEQQGGDAEAAYWAGWAALSYARLGRFDRAESWTARIPAMAERSGDPVAIMDVKIHTAMVETLRGNFEDATELVRKGIELAEQIDNKECLLVALYVEGEQHLERGNPEEAVGALQRSTDVARYCNMADFENLGRAMLSLARAQSGTGDQSLADIDASLEAARSRGDRLGEAEILRARGIARAGLESPEWPAVEADFQAAIELFERMKTRPYLARALRDYGLALESAGRLFDGRERLEEAARLFREMGISSPSGASSDASRAARARPAVT